MVATRTRTWALAVALALVVPACKVQERRVSTLHPDYEGGTVDARVEKRDGRKRGTWKPYVASVLGLAAVASAGMIVAGFYDPRKRWVANSGIVLAAVLPLFAIPFVVKSDTPWVRTKWSAWEPAPGTDARIDVIGRDPQPILSSTVRTDPQGHLRVQLEPTLCPTPTWKSLGMIDLVVRVRDAETEPSLAMPVDRLEPRCTKNLSLLGRAPEVGP